MIEIEEIERLDPDFIDRVEDFASEEPFQLFYLFTGINMVNLDNTNFYDCFFLKNGKTIKIIGLLLDSTYYFYGKDWTEAELEKLIERIDFQSFPHGFHFVGTHDLINQLMAKTNIKTSDFKDRFFFKISDKIKSSNTVPIIKPKLSELSDLAALCMEAHREEYKELSIRPIEDFVNMARNQISNSNILVNKKGTEITGFCTAMHTDSDEPMIGTLYVREKFRNCGIGKSLLLNITSELMQKAKACYLVTERSNKSAIKVIESIGYSNIYEHMDKIITVANKA